jgi:hypothetical protein
VSWLAQPVTTALRRLAQLDPQRAAALARRVLDVLGPREEHVRTTLLELASELGDAAFAAVVTERWLASGAPGAERWSRLLLVAELRRQAGDPDGAARALCRALVEGADAQRVLSALDRALPPTSSDGEVSLLEARAEALSALSGADLQGAAQAWREFGAALWDLAGDTEGALHAWERAASLDPETGPYRLALDVAAFAGPNRAAPLLAALAARRQDVRESARLYTLAASVALEARASREALTFAERAIELDSAQAEALAIAERAAGEGDLDVLERLYAVLAERALGCFGERAAHYRAARQLERRGALRAALDHAVRAFEVVPAPGVTFVLMARLAERLEDPAELVRTIERVASSLEDPGVRAAWLIRAANFAGSSEEGKRQRLEMLFRALTLRPDVHLLEDVGRAIRELVSVCPDERELLELRLERAVTALLHHGSGPDGARLGVAAAQVALTTLGLSSLALYALRRALQSDSSIDEYSQLLVHLAALLRDPEGTRSFVEQVVEREAEPYANIGRPALELAIAAAEGLADRGLTSRLLTRTAARFKEDAALVQRAEALARGLREREAAEELDRLERDAEKNQDHAALAAVLERRIAAEAHAPVARRFRLRRAQALEHAGQREPARSELEALLAEMGDDPSVIGALAELEARAGDEPRAARVWARASAAARERGEASLFARKAVEAYLRAGQTVDARRILDEQGAVAAKSLLDLRVEVERRGGDPRALAAALEDYADGADETADRRAALLVEAARAAQTAGDAELALDLVQRAARLAPGQAVPQLMARHLEYRARGVGSAEDAQRTLESLKNLEGSLTAPQVELRTFLVAEARDAIEPGSGHAELERALDECGARPLIALALAERLARAGDPERALAYFDLALAADLRGLRARGGVALAAAGAAERLGELDRAGNYLELAASEAETRDEALARSRALESARIAEALPAPGEPDVTAYSTPPPVTRGYSSAPPRESVAPVTRGYSSAPPREAAPSTSAAISKTTRGYSSVPPPESASLLLRGDSSMPPREALPLDGRGSGGQRVSVPPAVSGSVRPMPIVPVGALRVSERPPDVNATRSDEELAQALDEGSTSAGLTLLERLETRRAEVRSRLGVAKRLMSVAPGDPELVARAMETVRQDHDVTYSAALEHARRALEGSVPDVSPPPLAQQPEQPEGVRTLLFRDLAGPAREALSIVWEGASHVFRRDPASYGVTGLERVGFGAPTAVSRSYTVAARALGITAPLFQRKGYGEPSLSALLLSPPALLLTGDVRRESAELGYHLGAMLAATLPENIMLFGAPEEQVRSVLRALALAFGPPAESRASLTGVATLAEVLWESVPARMQRRLRELCDRPTELDYDRALAAARQAVRRAGLFVCGDLHVSLEEVAGELGHSISALRAGGVADACTKLPEIADLVRFATSSEYAEARWHTPRSRAI